LAAGFTRVFAATVFSTTGESTLLAAVGFFVVVAIASSFCAFVMNSAWR
jgi:hypothetical protein